MIYRKAMDPARIPAVADPVEACMYCWYVLHPMEGYPEEWSSTCCEGHQEWLLAQYAQIRAKRGAVAAISQTGVVA